MEPAVLFPYHLVEWCLENEGTEIVATPKSHKLKFAFASTCVEPAPSNATLPVVSELSAERLSPDCPAVIVVENSGAHEIQQSHLNAYLIGTHRSAPEVADGINRQLARIVDWKAEMSDLLESDCPMEALLTTSEPLLGKYLGLSNSLFQLVATTPGIPPLDPMSKELVASGTYPSEAMRQIERLSETQDWKSQLKTSVDNAGNLINPLPNANRVYHLNGSYAAHLVMVSEEPLTPADIYLFDLLADKVAKRFERLWKVSSTYHEPYSPFLHMLLMSPVPDMAFFERQTERFGLPTQGVFKVGIIADAERRGGLDHIARQLAITLRNCWAVIESDKIYVLLYASTRERGAIHELEEALFDLVERLQSKIGISSSFEELRYCHLARRQADIALEYGSKNVMVYSMLEGLEPRLFYVFRFKRYFPCFLTDPYSETASFVAEYENTPGPIYQLREADKRNGTNDFGLLKIYLYVDSNIKRTCELLHMHRNTVSYRLNKIKEEYGIDLDDDDERLFLHYLFSVLD